jgi:hypothetical protein
MLENVSKNLLINIKRIILGHLKKKKIKNGLEWPDNLFFKEIESIIHKNIDESNRKVQIIREIPNSKRFALKHIYKNV